MDYTSIKVGQLPTDEISGGNFIPHEVAGVLKKATFTDLAAFIGASDAVGFRAVSVSNGGTLPATTTQEFILVGPGTYNNVGGGSTITVTEELNALVSNGTYWFIGVEIPIDAPPGNAIWGQIVGTLSNQTDLQNLFNLKADLVDGKIPSSQLPSYVDDVIEVANYAALPATGETGKIYITIDTEYIYRWSGSAYIRIVDEAAAWGTITGTLSNQTDLQNALNAKEDDIAAGTTAQYWRGDKSWQTLNKAAVGLSNVDNTSDLNKPISTATQTALDGKFDDPTGDTTQYIAGDGSLITFPIAGQAGTLVRLVRNNSGATITKGTVVYINGASGNNPTIAKALATGDSTSAQTFGLVQSNISNNSNGYVVVTGDLIGIDTSGITEGSQLYLSSTTAGEYTTTKQLAPAHLVYVGVVTRSHPTLGQIEVKIQNGYELDEIHDVAISSKTNKDFLVYESSTDLWKNKSLGTIVGGTISQFIKGDGTLDSTTYIDNVNAQTVGGVKTFSNMPILGAGSGVNGQIVYADSSNQLKTITNFKYNDSTGVITTLLGNLGSNAYTSTAYQPLLTNPITGSTLLSGNTGDGYIPRASSSQQITNSLIYDNGNNIGIGTASPAAKLSVSYSSATADALNIVNTNTNGRSWYVGDGAGLGAGNFGFYDATAGASRLVISSGGNVGIGTTSPLNRLDVNVSNASGSGAVLSNGSSVFSKWGMVNYGVDNNSFIGSFSNNSFLLYTNSSERMRITSGGLVGIGTTSPSSRLHISSSSNTPFRMTRTGLSDYSFELGATNDLYLVNNGIGSYPLTVLQSGNIGINTITPSYTLHVNGSVAGTSAYVNLSDKRHKKDILPIENALNKILALNGVTFNWDKESTDMNLDDNNHIGLIAQDVEKIIPQAVVTAEDENKTKSVAYTDLVPVLIEAIKELKAEIEILKNK